MPVAAEKSPKEYLSQIEAAAMIGCHVNTLVALSKSPDGPPRSKVTNRLVRYRRSDLIEWMESKKEAA
jgi:predicted DNA-binding transcriptional regulator AlpA